mmetsp:Transcript_3846/g.10092  ORF Transcript_3846/g.10092 Transcript_3846/m.10092 type:complete len:101 (-) Transcript_3846:276-578(-)
MPGIGEDGPGADRHDRVLDEDRIRKFVQRRETYHRDMFPEGSQIVLVFDRGDAVIDAAVALASTGSGHGEGIGKRSRHPPCDREGVIPNAPLLLATEPIF